MSRTPIPSFRLCLLAALAAAPGAFAQTAPGPAAAGPGDRVVLPEFAVVESRLARDAALSPANVPLDSLFAPGLTIGEVPRSVSVVTPEAMATFGIRSFADLEKAGPGTARLNYFGIAGTPILRGTEAGVYFDGMLRAYQRNEMPVSFESLERLDVVRGAAPAQFTPTPIGGFVNFVPKAPFFDQPHEGIEVSGGSGDFSRAQADVGGPQPGGRAAWRATATVQRDGTPYRNLRNDYESVYAVATFRPADGVTATVGAEYYDYRSNENLGWNRVTADLIDRGAYVRGEPADLTSAAWGGKVTRTLLEFPYSSLVNPRLHSLAVSGAIARAQIPDALRATMIDLNDPAQVAALYVLRADDDVPAFLKADPALYAQRRATAQAALDLIARHPQDAFVYTPQYFAAGGTALTTTLARDRVLADPDDFANARNALLFFNWENTRDPALTWKNQVFLETLATRKYSSYGYATQTGQVVLSDKFTLVRNLPAWRSRLTAGAELRAVSSLMRQDYAAEVFGRRDLSADTLSANSLIPAGATPAPDGLNLVHLRRRQPPLAGGPGRSVRESGDNMDALARHPHQCARRRARLPHHAAVRHRPRHRRARQQSRPARSHRLAARGVPAGDRAGARPARLRRAPALHRRRSRAGRRDLRSRELLEGPLRRDGREGGTRPRVRRHALRLPLGAVELQLPRRPGRARRGSRRRGGTHLGTGPPVLAGGQRDRAAAILSRRHGRLRRNPPERPGLGVDRRDFLRRRQPDVSQQPGDDLPGVSGTLLPPGGPRAIERRLERLGRGHLARWFLGQL